MDWRSVDSRGAIGSGGVSGGVGEREEDGEEDMGTPSGWPFVPMPF